MTSSLSSHSPSSNLPWPMTELVTDFRISTREWLFLSVFWPPPLFLSPPFPSALPLFIRLPYSLSLSLPSPLSLPFSLSSPSLYSFSSLLSLPPPPSLPSLCPSFSSFVSRLCRLCHFAVKVFVFLPQEWFFTARLFVKSRCLKQGMLSLKLISAHARWLFTRKLWRHDVRPWGLDCVS